LSDIVSLLERAIMPEPVRRATAGAETYRLRQPGAALWLGEKTAETQGGKMKKIIAAALAATAIAVPASAETFAVRAGRVIVDAAKPARGPSTIIVENGRISRIEDGHGATPAGATVVDLSTKTILPGLIDAHVHLATLPGTPFWREAIDSDEHATAVGLMNALITARAGFTTVRDLGAPGRSSFAIRDAVAQGLMPGPRVVASGPAVSIIGGHGDVSGFKPEVNAALSGGNTCTGPEECAARVREISKNGADVIKITATGGVLSQQGRGLEAHFTDLEMKSIVATADKLGLKVAAHAHGPRGVESAVRAGVDSIEHGVFADEAAMRAMKEKGTWFVPTLMALQGLVDRIGKNVYTPTVEVKAKQAAEARGRALAMAHRMGIKIAFGTDAGVFEHGRNGEEAQAMVQYGGMTPREVLVTATRGAAELLGIAAETGTLEPGKSADFIAVDGDPLADARALTRVGYVMVMGRPVPMK
jgi:imidazolonepropionase-like amidohydrolase